MKLQLKPALGALTAAALLAVMPAYAAIDSVNINSNGWLVVEGYSAKAGDRILLEIDGELQFFLPIHPAGDDGQYRVIFPMRLLLGQPDGKIAVKVTALPPRYLEFAEPTIDHFVWEGFVSRSAGEYAAWRLRSESKDPGTTPV